jgi:hypothetical protein
MYFMGGSQTELFNSEHIERLKVLEKSDAYLVVAMYGADVQPVTAGRYASLKEAMDALYFLQYALAGGKDYYTMPPNTGTFVPPDRPQNGWHGKKPTRRGGS